MIEEPNISISKKTNEENMQSVKSWCGSAVEEIQYLKNRVEALESRITTLESEEE